MDLKKKKKNILILIVWNKLRLSTKTTAPRRISLHQSVLTRNNLDDSFNQKVKNDSIEYDGSFTVYTSDRLHMKPSNDPFDGNNWSLHEMMEDSASTGIVLKSNEPWRQTATKLYNEFLEIIQAHSNQTQVFETIGDFIQNCSDTLQIMREMQSKVDTTKRSNEELSLENERNTWRLIYCLYQNRLASQNYQNQMDCDDDDDNNNTHISEKDVINNLIKNESQIREYQLIIDWLEQNALDQAESLPKIEHYTDKTVAWENTIHQINNKKTGISFGSLRQIVESLDPDAPIREGKPLHDLDKEDDKRLEKRMFIEVRCGRLQRAQELAIHCGQPWRAACLLGWQPHHDPNYNNPLNDTKLPIEGNPNRGLWKLNAWHMSKDTRIGIYYRSIYASLCGNVEQLLDVACSWQDGLWSYMKTLMDIEVENELRGIMSKNYPNMTDDYWKSKKSLVDIFDNLQSSKINEIRNQSNKPEHIIQKYLILDDIQKLMEQINIWIDDKICQPQFIRFLAHLILFLRQIGKNINDKIANKVLLTYVNDVLIEIGDSILIAYYTSQLPKDEQIIIYASYLENIKNYDMRKKCLVAAEEANLNVEAITKLVVENIRNKNIVNSFDNNELSCKINDDDIEKIEALDWLTFYEGQRDEALWQANALIRYFLTCEKVDAARRAFNKMPADSIEVIMMEHPSLEETMPNVSIVNEPVYKASASIREYLCYKAYLDAQEGFQEWFSHFHQGKPAPLESMSTYPTFTEKVAHDHKKAQYAAELERWKCTMEHHTKAVKQLLYNILLFPDGGWLSDSNTDPVSEDTPEHILRKHQLDKLRSLCIPKVVLLLLNVMSEMNEHENCVELADTIASSQYKLYKHFSTERMREVYRKISESSIILMDQKKDAWGYSR
ncbi:nuclear pore complex protein Nup107 isoform X2 [Aphidius gifuensis]|uniref:nuclear pore complex protein Nup107 isoform X2 n=1 Tax=Aphidius gifuensis TaxID=684658 RepID=UPI001CDD6E23|nr:nuclear pore complex protein Nup107 isoform X2 [Aphidius gifuensis]